MAGPAILKIDIVGDASKAIKALDQTSDAAGKAEGGWSKAGKAIGGVVGAAAIASFGKASVDAATESAVATARLEQVFRSMGDTTGEASKAAEGYASALSKKIGVDDEAIMAAQAQLATFGAVSDATARTAGVFDRATSAAADLAAAGFGTLDSNAVQLGKALQDPTKGLTALAKSGVTFTESQKAQIQALQESGDLLGAQKIVLAAVEGQVKGTAEATVTSQQKAALAYGELQEQIGGKLLPVVNLAMNVFTKYSSVLGPLAAVIAAVVAVQWLWNIAVAANPIGLIVIAIAAFIAGIVLLFTKVDFLRNLLESVWGWIAANWPLLLAILLGPFGVLVAVVVKNFDTIKNAIAVVVDWIRDNWPLLLAILTGPIGIAMLFIIRNFDTLKDAATAVVGWVSDRFQDLVGFLSRVAQGIGSVMGSIVDAIRWPIQAAADAFNAVTDFYGRILDFLWGMVGKVAGVAGDIAGALKGPLNAVIRAWNALEFTVPSVDVGPVHFGGQTIGLPDIPTLQRGGMVLRTGMALVHEGEQFSGAGRSFGNTTINVTVQTTGLGADAPQIQRAVVNALRGYTTRNGPLDVPVRTV